MPSYSNGYIPETLLVIFARGANTVDGPWYHGLSPATYARHLALVARSGGALAISDGWGAYRPYAAQVVARNVYGNGAAWPGTSSHGGFWEGRQTLAMDYSNWGSVYGWDRGRFAADCAAVGLTANMIVPERGYPDEPWHVIDLDPWSAVPTGAEYVSLEDDMGSIDQTAANQQFIMDAVIKALSSWKVVDGDKNIFDGIAARPVKQGVKDSLFEFYLGTPTPPDGHDTWPFFDFLVTAISRGDVEIDLDALAQKIIAGIPTSEASGPSVSDIASAVREVFRTSPLT